MTIRFQILGEIRNTQIIARGRSVRDRRRLDRMYGRGDWRKLKGVALVHDEYNEIYEAEIHWYEAHGIGKRQLKIKKRLR